MEEFIKRMKVKRWINGHLKLNTTNIYTCKSEYTQIKPNYKYIVHNLWLPGHTRPGVSHMTIEDLPSSSSIITNTFIKLLNVLDQKNNYMKTLKNTEHMF